MSRVIPLVCLAIIAAAARSLWSTVVTFLHTFPSWLWGDVGWATLFFSLALFTAVCFGVAGLWKVRDAIHERNHDA